MTFGLQVKIISHRFSVRDFFAKKKKKKLKNRYMDNIKIQAADPHNCLKKGRDTAQAV